MKEMGVSWKNNGNTVRFCTGGRHFQDNCEDSEYSLCIQFVFHDNGDYSEFYILDKNYST